MLQKTKDLIIKNMKWVILFISLVLYDKFNLSFIRAQNMLLLKISMYASTSISEVVSSTRLAVLFSALSTYMDAFDVYTGTLLHPQNPSAITKISKQFKNPKNVFFIVKPHI